MTDLLRTPLYQLHVELGAKMVPFTGYDMPVQFAGIMAERLNEKDANDPDSLKVDHFYVKRETTQGVLFIQIGRAHV